MPSPVATQAPIDTTGWIPYTSKQYGFTFARPADWDARAAVRPWTFVRDGTIDPTSTAMDSFVSPDDAVAVSFWAIGSERLAGGPTEGIRGVADLQNWAAAWCGITRNTVCDRIAERAIPMCLEYRDCHPALMVPYGTEVQAYFTDLTTGTMFVVAVWRPDGSQASARYGGSTAILGNFLSTMDVWPKGYLPPAISK